MNVSGFRLQSEKWSFSEFVKRVYQNEGLVSIVNDMTFVEKFYPCSCDFVLDNRLFTGAEKITLAFNRTKRCIRIDFLLDNRRTTTGAG